eukprot:scaffold161490_cov33-Prasinocladus_malaysianus.AAC.13
MGLPGVGLVGPRGTGGAVRLGLLAVGRRTRGTVKARRLVNLVLEIEGAGGAGLTGEVRRSHEARSAGNVELDGDGGGLEAIGVNGRPA